MTAPPLVCGLDDPEKHLVPRDFFGALYLKGGEGTGENPAKERVRYGVGGKDNE